MTDAEVEEKLKAVAEIAATMALGWAWAEACVQLDRGDDPRQWEVPELLPRMLKELD